MGYKLKNIYIGQQRIWPPVLFDYGDWTNSTWDVWYPYPSAKHGTVTQTSTYVSFYNSGDNSQNYLSQFPIDGTSDFLLEMNANIPSTNVSYHYLGLKDLAETSSFTFETRWENRNKIMCEVNGNSYAAEANPGQIDYFIRKEGSILTMGWGGVTKFTSDTVTFANEYYLFESVYNDTMTIYTAKLTYL